MWGTLDDAEERGQGMMVHKGGGRIGMGNGVCYVEEDK